jgi:hypothetical protein
MSDVYWLHTLWFVFVKTLLDTYLRFRTASMSSFFLKIYMFCHLGKIRFQNVLPGACQGRSMDTGQLLMVVSHRTTAVCNKSDFFPDDDGPLSSHFSSQDQRANNQILIASW